MISTKDEEWLHAEEPGWSRVDRVERLSIANYVSGDTEGARHRVVYFKNPEGDRILTKVWFGPGTQGPPGHAHGGSMAAMLDEAMGFAAWMAGHTVLAAELRVRFRRMLPLKTLCRIEPRVVSVNGRQVRVQGQLADRDGVVYTDAEGLFIVIDPARLGEALQKLNHALNGTSGEDDGR